MKHWTIDELKVLSASELAELRRRLMQQLETNAMSERCLALDTLARVDFVLARKISRPLLRPGPGGPRPPSP